MRAQGELRGLTCFRGIGADPMSVVRPDPEMGNQAQMARTDPLETELEMIRQQFCDMKSGKKGFFREGMR